METPYIHQNVYKLFWSQDQDGQHTHIWLKTLYKTPEPGGRLPWDLLCSSGDAGPTNFVQMMILG